jgi:hypothetical protein
VIEEVKHEKFLIFNKNYLDIAVSLQEQLTSAFSKEHANLISLQLLELSLPEEIKQTLILTEQNNLDLLIAKNNQMAATNTLYAERSKAIITANNYYQMADILNSKYTNVRLHSFFINHI